MPQERGFTELPREFRDQEPFGFLGRSGRDPPSGAADTPRENKNEQLARTEASVQEPLAHRLVTLGAIIAGAGFAGRWLHASRFGVEILHGVGQMGRNIRGKGYDVLGALMPDRTAVHLRARSVATARGSAGPEIADLEVVKDITDYITLMGSTAGARKTSNQLVGIHFREQLRNITARSPGGMRFLNVGDVLTGKASVSAADRAVLEQGISAKLLDASTPLGKGLFHSRGKVVDTRWASPSNLLRGAIKALNTIKIPGTRFRLGSLFDVPRQILGTHRGVAAVGRVPIGSGQRLKMGGVIINGTLFGRTGPLSFNKIGTGYKPIKNRGILSAALGSIYRTAKVARPARSGIFAQIEELLGIGPTYATEESVFSRFIKKPLQRLARDEPIRLKKTVEKRFTYSSTRDRIAAQLAGELDGTVPNPKTAAEVSSIDWIRALFGKGRFVEYADDAAPRRVVVGVPGAGLDDLVMHKRDKIPLLAQWLAYRPVDLFSWTTGVGFKPGQGRFGAVTTYARMVGVGYLGLGAIQAARYVDYQLEDIGDTLGSPIPISPIKAVASIYAGARITQAHIREQLGITRAANYLEDLMPMSMSSTGSGIARMLGPVLVGGLLGGTPGFIGGVAASLLLGSPEGVFAPEAILQGGEETQRIFSGDKRIPVRQGRWWILGRTPFEGGRVTRLKSHWYAELMSDYQYTDTGYGSKRNYWRNVSSLPTPSNLFGLIPALNPGWMAEKHAHDRPYPVIPGSILVSAKRLIPLAPTQVNQQVSDLGMGNIPSAGTPADPYSGRQRLSNYFERGTEFFGVWKFFGEQIFGRHPLGADIELASAEQMTSTSKSFWDKELGGIFGLTEGIRRFLPSENTFSDTVNPLPNMAEDWLPGDRSIFPEDRQYFRNFHRGDPFGSIKGGETRLPGGAYEALYRMHSGVPGIYDAVDRYMILADVAPWSQAFQNYRTIVEAWALAGHLNEDWTRKWQETEMQVQDMKRAHRFVRRKAHAEDQLREVNEAIKRSGFERTLSGAWVSFTSDVVAHIPVVGTKFLNVRTAEDRYRDRNIYGFGSSDWGTPYRSFIRPNLLRAMDRTPVIGSMDAMYLASIWAANPIASVAFSATVGAVTAIGSIRRVATTGRLSGGLITDETRRRWELQEYFDKIEYLRAKRLQGISMMIGDQVSALRYKEESDRTVVGLKYGASPGEIQAAMPATIKPFVKELLTTPREKRKDILSMLPPYTRGVFAQTWGRGVQRRQAAAEVSDYLSRTGLPNDSWLGWHPQVGANISKIKFIESGINSVANDLHSFGLWENEKLESPLGYAYMEVPRIDMRGGRPDGDIERQLRDELRRVDILELSVNGTPSFGSSLELDIQHDNSKGFREMATDILRGWR